MRLTSTRLLAVQNLGKLVSAFLALILLIQPSRAVAQSVTGIDDTAQELTVSGAVLGVPTEPVVQGPAQPPTIQDVLLEVCQDNGYGEDCAKHLLGILWKESQGNAKAVGDHGYAHGYFQINSYYNPGVKRDCAEDLRCSAEWTLTHLEQHGYPKYPARAIQCHNGCGFRNGYAAAVLRNANRLWPEPIAIALAQ